MNFLQQKKSFQFLSKKLKLKQEPGLIIITNY